MIKGVSECRKVASNQFPETSGIHLRFQKPTKRTENLIFKSPDKGEHESGRPHYWV